MVNGYAYGVMHEVALGVGGAPTLKQVFPTTLFARSYQMSVIPSEWNIQLWRNG